MELVEPGIPDLEYQDELNATLLERMPRLNLPTAELGKYFSVSNQLYNNHHYPNYSYHIFIFYTFPPSINIFFFQKKFSYKIKS